MSTNDVPLATANMWKADLEPNGYSSVSHYAAVLKETKQALATERARVCPVRPMDEWARLFVQVTGASHGVGAFLDMAEHLNLIAEKK